MSFLSLDIGITGCKAIIFNPDGKIEASAYREYPLIQPRTGWAELDPALVWIKLKEAIREVGGQVDVSSIKAASISSQGEACIPVDRDGQILYNSIVALDNRSEEMVVWWEDRIGRKRIFQITGMPLSGLYTLNKILWLRKNEPAIFKKAWKFLCYEDFVFYKMGLTPVIDYSLAGKTMALDIHNKCWSEELIKECGLEEEMFSQLSTSGEIIGEIGSTVAHELGLRPGIKVVTGGHDQVAGALGAGVLKSSVAMDSTGTTESIATIFDKPILSDDMLKYNYVWYPYVISDKYITIAYNFTAGSLLRWYRDTFGGEELSEARRTGRDVYDIIVGKAAEDPSSVYVLPHFTLTGTPFLDAYSKGAILGLTLSTSKSDIIKGLLEGLTFEMKLNLKYWSEAGVEIDEFRAIGGGARSKVWLQLKADMYGKRVVSLEVTDAPCLGVAILSGLATGEYSSPEEAIKRTVHIKEVFTPNQGNFEIYNKRLKIYERIYPSIVSLNHQMKDIDSIAQPS